MDTLLPYLYIIVSGLRETLIITIGGFSLATFLGFIFAFFTIFGPRYLSLAIDILLRILRGIPLVLMLFIVFYGFPRMGIQLPPVLSAIVGIAIVDSAYQAQLFRGVAMSVIARQLDAALSIGMDRWSSFRSIVLPQTFLMSLPGWINEFSIVLKDSSIAYAIGVSEMFTQAIHVANATMNYLIPLSFAALVYFSICFPLSLLSNTIHRRLKMMGFA